MLIELNIDVAHIDEGGMIKKQVEVIQNVIGNQPPLFDGQNEIVGFSRKKYTVPSERT
jgi:hypothetical protein